MKSGKKGALFKSRRKRKRASRPHEWGTSRRWVIYGGVVFKRTKLRVSGYGLGEEKNGPETERGWSEWGPI